jgi:hypothetical protein
MLADPVKFGEIPAVPYRLAFQQVLAECAKVMILLGRGNIVTFGHDDGEDFHILNGLYKEFKKRNPRYQRLMADFVPLDDKLHPPIQAADVAAYVTYKYAEAYAENPTPDNLKRLRGNMFKVVNWLDQPVPTKPDFTTEELPAKAIYVP